MNIEEFLESAMAKKTSEEKEKPSNHESKPVRRVTTSGATIGDGMRTTAKVAAATTVFTIMIHSAPMLFAALFGGIFMLKGCDRPKPIPFGAAPLQSSIPTPVVATIPMSSPKISPRELKVQTDQAATLLAEPYLPIPASYQSQAQDQQREILVPERSQSTIPPQPDAAELSIPTPMFDPLGSGINSRQRPTTVFPFMTDRLASPDLGQETLGMVDAAVFDFRRGRTYHGTCQMPGAASKRMSLSVDSIRDRGTSIKARLALLESPRTSKKYSGTVENNPPRLILTPQSEGNGFGTFLTYMPWYSNSPTTITLEMSKDGMRLEGTSGSSEQFDLVARSELTSNPRHEITRPQFNGFDEVDSKASVWSIQTIDSRALATNKKQSWTFNALEDGVGTFVWTEGDKTLASGTYKEDVNEYSLDIITLRGTQQRIFRALVKVSADANSLLVCVPKNPDSPRPREVSPANCRIYEMVLSN